MTKAEDYSQQSSDHLILPASASQIALFQVLQFDLFTIDLVRLYTKLVVIGFHFQYIGKCYERNKEIFRYCVKNNSIIISPIY